MSAWDPIEWNRNRYMIIFRVSWGSLKTFSIRTPWLLHGLFPTSVTITQEGKIWLIRHRLALEMVFNKVNGHAKITLRQYSIRLGCNTWKISIHWISSSITLTSLAIPNYLSHEVRAPFVFGTLYASHLSPMDLLSIHVKVIWSDPCIFRLFLLKVLSWREISKWKLSIVYHNTHTYTQMYIWTEPFF